MNVNYDDVIVFKTLAGGYYCLAIGRVSEYTFDTHLEVEHHKVFHSFNSPYKDKIGHCSHRVGYNNIKKVIPEKYLKNTSAIIVDYPELLI